MSLTFRKNRSSNFIPYFLLTSFVCGALGGDRLFAATSVTSTTDDGTGDAGTLSAAINTVNGTPSDGPIQIERGASPLEIGADMPFITETLTIESNGRGQFRTISGNGFEVISVTSRSTTLTPDITLSNVNTSVTGSGILDFEGPANWSGVNTIDLISGGTVRFLPDTSNIYAGAISTDISGTIFGAGLTITGHISEASSGSSLSFEGDMVLDNSLTTNDWTGGTIVSGGLGINHSGSIPHSGDIVISSSGELVFASSDTDPYTLSGNITILNEVSPIVINSGNITFSGAVGVASDSTITVNGGTATFSGTCGIREFLLDKPSTVYITGVLTGSAGFVFQGGQYGPTSSVLHFSNVQTYTGYTNIGYYLTVYVDEGASFGTSSEEVTVNGGPPVLINSGAITASTFSNHGTTTLNTGSTITCSESYSNYGTVTGCGTVTVGGSYVNSGTTSPGCSPSPLTIIGNALYVPGSVLSPYLDSSGVAGLNVSGDLTLDPGVFLVFRPEPGCYTNGQSHPFLTVGGTFEGTFSTVDMGTILLIPNITYGDHGAILTIERAPLGTLVPENNAKHVGQVLDVLIEEGIGSGDLTFCELIGDLLLLSQEGLSTVLNQLQPALFKGLAISQESSMVRVQESLNNRMQTVLSEKHCRALPYKEDQTDAKAKTCSQDKKPFHVWAAGMGNALYQGSAYYAGSPQYGYHETMGGATLGIDAFFAKYLYAGVLGAYTSSDVKWNDGQGKGNIQSGYAGTYFSAIGDMFYGNASVIGSLNSYHAERTVFLPTSQRTAKNNHGGPQLLSHLDTGVNLGWGRFSLKPFDSFDYIVQKERSFTETGAGNLDLSVKKSNAILIRNELGLNFSGCFCTARSRWIISPKISWVREVRVTGSSYTANFVNTKETFTVEGYFPDRSLVSPGVNVTGTMLEDRLTLTAYYNGEIRGNYNNHSYGGEVRFGF